MRSAQHFPHTIGPLLANWSWPKRILLALCLLSMLMLLARIPKQRVHAALVASDGVGYYSFLRSIVIDHDLDFSNEYAHYQIETSFYGLTPTGRAANKYAIGTALLWLPFFLVAHGVAYAGAALGFDVVPNGYGYLYEGAISIASVVYGSLGFALAYGSARRLWRQSSALLAVVALWLASNSIYYMVFEPSMAHMAALFSVSLTLSIWFHWFRQDREPSIRRTLLLGAASGLVLLVRLQDAPFLLLPYGWSFGRALYAWRAGAREHAWRWLRCIMIGLTTATLCFVPQLLVWRLLYGAWSSPQAVEHDPAFYWLVPQIRAVLFSTFHGLFVWHPVFLLACVGLITIALRDRWLAVALIAVVAVEVYVVAAWWAWWQGASFGGRMFLSAMWLWVFGLTALFDWLRQRPRLFSAAIAASVLLVIWNALALLQYRLLRVPANSPLTWEQMTWDRVEFAAMLLRRLLYE